MRHCPSCGSEVSDSDKFCYKCGTVLEPVQGGNGPVTEGSAAFSPPPAVPQKRSSVLPAVLIVAGLLFASVGGVLLISQSFPLDSSDDMKMTYSWKYDADTFSYDLTVKKADYNAMMKSTIERTGTTSSDQYKDANGKTVFAVKDYVVVDAYVNKVAADLKTMFNAKYSHDPSSDEMSKFVTAFVQGSMRYEEDSVHHGSEYWKFPLETLCDKKGDCEDTAILTAALLDAAGYDGYVVLLPEHAMAGIKSTYITVPGPYIAKHTDLYGGADYYLIETATNGSYKDLGWCNDKYTGVYFHPYHGSVTSYYGVA